MDPEFTFNTASSGAKAVDQIPFVHFSASGNGLGISNISELLYFFTSSTFFDFLSFAWSFFSILSYIVSIILLVLYVFASTRKNLYFGLIDQELRDQEKMYDEKYRGAPRNSRMQDILEFSTSSNPSDWKQAVIEADIILDEVLEQRGFEGGSLGERLKNISSQQLATLNDAWEAHKIRNRIAHDGSDFILTKRIAQETIVRYQRVFDELDVT